MKLPVPPSFLFTFCYSCRYVSPTAFSGGRPPVFTRADTGLPAITSLIDEAPLFGVAFTYWNERGVGFQFDVVNGEPIWLDPVQPAHSDGITVWIDTRDTRSIHRASRYCHQFVFLPRGRATDGSPEVMRIPIHRAQEEPPVIDLSPVVLTRRVLNTQGNTIRGDVPVAKIDSYSLSAWLPASTLHGFDPDVNSRLGFFYRIRSRSHGEQLLTAGPDFPYAEDPSLWQILELTPGAEAAPPPARKKKAAPSPSKRRKS